MTFMFFWCFTITVITNPGSVPLYWVISINIVYDLFNKGFYMEAPEERKRRYCLVCHKFKPERCHHCS